MDVVVVDPDRAFIRQRGEQFLDGTLEIVEQVVSHRSGDRVNLIEVDLPVDLEEIAPDKGPLEQREVDFRKRVAQTGDKGFAHRGLGHFPRAGEVKVFFLEIEELRFLRLFDDRIGNLAAGGKTGQIILLYPCDKRLDQDDIVKLERDVESVVPPAVRYSLTPLGRRFVDLIDLVYDWGRRNSDALDAMQVRASSRRGVG